MTTQREGQSLNSVPHLGQTSPETPWGNLDSSLLWSGSSCQQLSYCCAPGTGGGSDKDGCAGAGQILDEKKSLSQELTVQLRKNKHTLDQTYVSLPNKMT